MSQNTKMERSSKPEELEGRSASTKLELHPTSTARVSFNTMCSIHLLWYFVSNRASEMKICIYQIKYNVTHLMIFYALQAAVASCNIRSMVCWLESVTTAKENERRFSKTLIQGVVPFKPQNRLDAFPRRENKSFQNRCPRPDIFRKDNICSTQQYETNHDGPTNSDDRVYETPRQEDHLSCQENQTPKTKCSGKTINQCSRLKPVFRGFDHVHIVPLIEKSTFNPNRSNRVCLRLTAALHPVVFSSESCRAQRAIPDTALIPHVIIDAVLMYVEADGKEASRMLEIKSEKVCADCQERSRYVF